MLVRRTAHGFFTEPRGYARLRTLPTRWRRWVSVVFALCSILLALSTARAAPGDDTPTSTSPASEPSEAERAEERAIREFMRAGVHETEAGNWENAARAYQSAWRLKQHFAIALSLAEAEMKLGNYLKAAELWQFYLAHAPPHLKIPDTDVEAALSECRSHLGSVRITVDGDGGPATLLVDEQDVGPPPPKSEVWLAPGSHELRARRGDALSRPALVQVEAGSTEAVHLMFPGAEPTPPSTTGAPQSPPSPLERDSAPPSNATRTYVLVGGIALTVVALGVGAGYRIQAAHLDDEADSTRAAVRQQAEDDGLEPDTACSQPTNVRPAACSTLTDQLDDRNHASAISNGAFIAAGVVGIGTVATYLLWPSDDRGGDHSPAAPTTVGLWWSDSVRGLSFRSKSELLDSDTMPLTSAPLAGRRQKPFHALVAFCPCMD